MRITFFVFNIDGMGGTSRSAITQANALATGAARHDVRILSVTRSAAAPHYGIDPAIEVGYLVDVRDPEAPATVADLGVDAGTARALHGRESSLVPARWDRQFTALCDVAMEAALPAVETDVLVTVTPGLLACAVELTADAVVVVHQEHRSSSDRTAGLEPLLTYSPRADVVALLTPGIETWLRDRLGVLAPHTVVMPNPLPLGFLPRSSLERPLIMTAGRLVPEKQFGRLVEAFGQIAHLVPEWRLRICGEGPTRNDLLRLVRKRDLWDRVELPGSIPDMAGEWPKASIAALTSRAEGFPLVVQEAMAAGVPVVSFDCPSGPREIIEHDVNGLLVGPQSVTGMAAALLRLTTDPALLRRLGDGALASSEQYDAFAIADRWTTIFTEASSRRDGRGRLDARAHDGLPRRGLREKIAAKAQAVARRVGSSDADVLGVTPAQARHAALRHAVDAVRAGTDTWLVIPAHENGWPTVVAPMTARGAVLDALVGAATPAYLSLRDPELHGWHERRGPVAELAADLRHGMTSSLFLEPWPGQDGRHEGRTSLLGQGCSVEVQFWETSADGELVAPTRNRYANRIPADFTRDAVTVEVDGLEVRTLPLMAAPTATECRFPVDVVYTWVDGTDDAWNAGREARLAEVTGTAQTRESSGRARFTDRGELRYSLRSVHLFAPWVRRIHLVTAGQVPDWLDPDDPRINVVDHRDLLPPEALPTFNSHAIESVLHRIEGLAEHFVYLNDDFLLGRPVRAEQFFTSSGLNLAFPCHSTVGLTDMPGTPPYLKAAWNNRRLLGDAFGVATIANMAHAPYAHRVSTLRAVEERWPAEVAATTHAPFRSDTDLSLLSSFAQHYGLLTGTAVATAPNAAFVAISNPDVESQLRRLFAREHDSICLGDFHDHALPPDRLAAVLAEWFEAYFPVAAPWERDQPR